MTHDSRQAIKRSGYLLADLFSVLTAEAAATSRALRDSLMDPVTGSRPKYLTCMDWPTSRPRTLG
jgi:hypothetical protein